jgi:hypothetical protein
MRIKTITYGDASAKALPVLPARTLTHVYKNPKLRQITPFESSAMANLQPREP